MTKRFDFDGLGRLKNTKQDFFWQQVNMASLSAKAKSSEIACIVNERAGTIR
jgi:hypothetical protein